LIYAVFSGLRPLVEIFRLLGLRPLVDIFRLLGLLWVGML